jgi:hypothetical protein
LRPTTTNTRAQGPIGAPSADLGDISKAWTRAIAKYPAGEVDLDRAYRRNLTAFVVRSVVIFLIGAYALHAAASPELSVNTGNLLALAPFIALIVVNLSILGRNGGWLGSVISTLKTRPDIGLPWLINLPAMKRVRALSSVLVWLLPVFLILHVVMPAATYAELHRSYDITAYFCLGLVCLWVFNFVTFDLPLFRAVRDRLAEITPQDSVVPSVDAW